MKDLIKKNFETYIDNFFNEGDDEKATLDKLASDGSQNIALLAAMVESYIGKVTDDNKETISKEIADLLVNMITLTTTFGVVKFLEDLAEESGVDGND